MAIRAARVDPVTCRHVDARNDLVVGHVVRRFGVSRDLDGVVVPPYETVRIERGRCFRLAKARKLPTRRS